MQVTLRLDDQLHAALKGAAEASGRSLNAWTAEVLAAAVDPDLGADEGERIRARLRRAGLLDESNRPLPARPGPVRVAQARARAGQGTPPSRLVSEGRGR